MKSFWAAFSPVIKFFFKGQTRLLLLGMLLAVITALANSALLGVSGWFITATFLAGLSASAAAAFNIFIPSATIRFLALARTAARYGERLTTHDATLAVLAAMRERIFRSFALPETAQILRFQPTKLLFRLTVDIDALDSFYLRLIVPFFSALCVMGATGMILSCFHGGFAALIVFALILTGFGLPAFAAYRTRRIIRQKAYAVESLRSRVIDLVAGQTDLLLADRLPAQCHSIMKAERKAAQADDRLNRTDILVSAGFSAASAFFLSGTLLAIVFFVRSNLVSISTGAFIVLLVLVALEPFFALQRGALELGRAYLASRRLGDKLQPVRPPSVSALPLLEGQALTIRDLSVRPSLQMPAVISGFSLDLAEGEHLALIGASGTGKTTFLRTIAGENTYWSGEIRNIPATLLTQKTELFQDSLRENLRLADPQATDQQLQEVLDIAGLGPLMAELPDGLDTCLGEGGLGLSAGQARRLSLARLFLRNTKLWLLDEPTEGLDPETARDVLIRLRHRAAGHSLIIATHNRREAELADKLIIINNSVFSGEISKNSDKFEFIINTLHQN